jgi:NADPH2:quinone reductase
MRAAYYERLGKASEVLVVGEMATPAPEPGCVLVRLHASGVNPSDVKARAGLRAGMKGIPYPRIIPHSDGAGVIEAVGEGIGASRVGERVWIWNGQWQRAFGTAATYIMLPAAQAVPLPDRVSYEEGACLGIPALTAHACVYADGPVTGKRVLVTGGAGAVGALAVRMAKQGGARVIATASSPEQAARATRAGADAIINHRADDFAAALREASGGALDRVVEVEFGGNIGVVAELIAPHGTIAAYASAAVPEPRIPFYPLMFKNVTLRMIIVYTLGAQARDAGVADINHWLARGELVPEVAAQFALEDIAAAHEAVERGGKLGSVVVTS